MRVMIVTLLGFAGFAAVVIGIVAFVGSRLPVSHVASRSILLPCSPEVVWSAISDFGAAPSWRSDVRRVDMLEPVDGRTRFREHGRHGAVTYEVSRAAPPELLITRIVDRDLGYSGSWTYSLAPENGGTRLTIEERGEVSNVIFRFVSRFVLGHDRTIETYQRALAKYSEGPKTP
ncbi:MAG TPA: SRPBCC family protein [Thermoanaerobaculia bacterium]|nr:SRPBCC family protein [Thermoanaerobaculia bacterium]